MGKYTKNRLWYKYVTGKEFKSSVLGRYAQPTFSRTKRLCAFTMAEVLITLGIIGIVAAMTLPSLIGNYRKKVTATRLKKFYSMMQQAIMLSEAQNGEYPIWAPTSDMEKDSAKLEEWYNIYLAPYITTINKEKADSTHFQAAFKDGSGFVAYTNSEGTMPIMFCVSLKHCGVEKYDGQNSFLFRLSKSKPAGEGYFKPYCTDYSREEMLENCKYGNYDSSGVSSVNRRHCCAALIRYDGWEIKDDYPWKQVILENK